MYLHLGNDIVVKKSQIIAIYDMDNTSISKSTKKFLNNAEKNKNVINVSFDIPKSFIIVNENGINKVYISQLAPQTLLKRSTSHRLD